MLSKHQTHIAKHIQSGFFQLRNIAQIKPLLLTNEITPFALHTDFLLVLNSLMKRG